MRPDNEMGVVKSIRRMTSKGGKVVLRATVDFYDGNAPDISPKTIWDRIPVMICECNVSATRDMEASNG